MNAKAAKYLWLTLSWIAAVGMTLAQPCTSGIRIPADTNLLLQVCLSESYTNTFTVAGETKRVIVRYTTNPAYTNHNIANVDTSPADGINDLAFAMAQDAEAAWRTNVAYGFAEPADPAAGDPTDDVEEIEFWVFAHRFTGGWCCDSAGAIYFHPDMLTRGRLVWRETLIHELFHVRHAGGWSQEGSAVAMQDATDAMIDVITNGFNFNADYFLARTTNDVTGRVHPYSHGLWWKYLMEQAGTNRMEPGYGVDFLMEFFKRRTIGTEFSLLDTMIRERTGDARDLESIWRDFTVANYAKDFSGPGVPATYRYVDEAFPPRYDYDTNSATPAVAVTLDVALAPGDSGVVGTAWAEPWSATYYRLRPQTNVAMLNLEFRQDTRARVAWTVLLFRAGDLAQEIRVTSRNLERSITNAAFDEVVVVLTSFSDFANYRYVVNSTTPVLHLLGPTPSQPAFVGSASTPGKFLAQVEVLDPSAGGVPAAGIDWRNLTLTVGGIVATQVTGAYLQGQYWVLAQAPTQAMAAPYALAATLMTLADTQSQAVVYGPRRDTDNLLVMDRSGSMGERDKMPAARSAARLFVDTWGTGDKIGVISFNANAETNLTLRDWTAANRDLAFQAITNLSPGGRTSIGDGLFAGLGELDARGDTNDVWALVVLSDGRENEPQSISDFLNAWKVRKATNLVPVVHAVAIGADANRGRLQEVATVTGGSYHYLAEPPPSAADPAFESGPPPLASPVNLPLDLAERFRVIAERLEREQQIYTARGTWTGPPDQHFIRVDAGAHEAVFVCHWHSPSSFSGPTAVSLHRPDGTAVGATRQDDNHVLFRIPLPPPGLWELRVEGCFEFCQADYLVEASLKSELTLDLLLGGTLTQRVEAAAVPILAGLTDAGPITGAVVNATIIVPEYVGSVDVLPAEIRTLRLYDDGAHNDGEAGDGWYGNLFTHTTRPGGYAVQVVATGHREGFGDFRRQASESFDLAAGTDSDRDGLADDWEMRFGLDPLNPSDRELDLDLDGLTSAEEYETGTDPSHSDTDGGGESDGSEVAAGRDPLAAVDDAIRPAWGLSEGVIPDDWLSGYEWGVGPTPFDNSVVLNLHADVTHTGLRLWRSLKPDSAYAVIAPGLQGGAPYADLQLQPGADYYYKVQAVGSTGVLGAVLGPLRVRTRQSPFEPRGSVLINNGAATTTSREVLLRLDATPGITEMRLSDHPSFLQVAWEPYHPQRLWRLAEGLPVGATAHVHAQFRNADGIESRPAYDSIQFGSGSGPTVICPTNLVVECAGPNGTPVDFSVATTDFCSANVTVTCVPPSGSLFFPGETIVVCVAQDDCAQMASCSFTVTVQDTTPPQLFCPSNVVATALSQAGAIVQFNVTATDACDPLVTAVCLPPSGSLFPIGTTLVTCAAQDGAGNLAHCEFPVTVLPQPPPDFKVTLANSNVYRAEFFINPSSQTAWWIKGVSAPGEVVFWTPKAAIPLAVGSLPANTFAWPATPDELRQFFIAADFAPSTTSEQAWLEYFPSEAQWNEGSSPIRTLSHYLSDSRGGWPRLVLPVTTPKGHTSYTVYYTDEVNNQRVLAPGWSIEVEPLNSVDLQQDIGGYAGTEDTDIRASAPDTNNGANHELFVGNNWGQPGGPARGLLRFHGLIGHQSGRVPPGAQIALATLTLYSTGSDADSPSAINLHRMLVDWNEASTWNTLGGGVSPDDVEALATPDATFVPDFTNPGGSNTQSRVIDVTASVQAWANGQTNYGWLLAATGDNTYAMDSSQHAHQTNHPKLQVHYSLPLTFANGLAFQAQGDAQLGLDQSNRLAVSNLGDSGQDGYRVVLGGADGYGEQFAPFLLPDNSVFETRAFGELQGLSDQEVARSRLMVSNGVVLLDAHFAWTGGAELQLEMRDTDGRLLEHRRVPDDVPVIVDLEPPGCCESFGIVVTEYVQKSDGMCLRFELLDCGPLCYESERILSIERVLCLNPIVQPAPPYVPPPIKYARRASVSYTNFVINRASMRIMSGDHSGLGNARLLATPLGLRVANIRSSGQDGVRVDLPPDTARALVVWAPLDPTQSAPVGAFLRLDIAGGEIESLGLPIGSVTLQKTAQGVDIQPDFSASGSGRQLIAILNQDQLVYTGLVHNASAATATAWPASQSIAGVMGPSDSHGIVGPSDLVGIVGPSDLHGIVSPTDLRWSQPTSFFTPAQQQVNGDRLIIVPLDVPGAFRTLRQWELHAAGLSEVEITREQAESAAAPFDGLAHLPLGRATLSPMDLPGGEKVLRVADIGSSGQDGVLVRLGRSESLGTGLPAMTPAGMPAGNVLTYSALGKPVDFAGAPAFPEIHLTVENDGAELTLLADFTALGAAIANVRVYDGSALVGDASGVPTTTSLVRLRELWPSVTDPCLPTGGPWQFVMRFPRQLPLPPPQITLANGQVVQGDRIVIEPAGPARAIEFVDRVRIRVRGLDTLDLQRAAAGKFGLLHRALGNARIEAGRGLLAVSRIGSSSFDGVVVRFDYFGSDPAWSTRQYKAQLVPLPIAAGDEFRLTAYGEFNGQSDTLLGALAWREVEPQPDFLVGDFTSLNAAAARVEVYLQGSLVGTREVPLSGETRLGWLSAATDGEPRLIRVGTTAIPTPDFVVGLDRPATFQALDLAAMVGDELRVIPLGMGSSIARLTHVDLTGMTLTSFALTGERVDTVAAALRIVVTGPGEATLSWTPSVPGFVLQERSSLTSGAWANAPSGTNNPVTVPATLPARFYRLHKP